MLSSRMLAGVAVALLGLGPAGGRQDELAPYDRQVVLETAGGAIVLEVFPEAAPEHVRAFVERVESGFYVGTTFHRVIPMGIMQGGDPLTKDRSATEAYGTGGLGEIPWHDSPLSHTRGTISAVLVPGDPDSAGSQFFICVTDQPQLDGSFTAFGRVVEGFPLLEELSMLGTPASGEVGTRIEITATSLRLRPPPRVIPFADATVDEMQAQEVVVTTDLGDFVIELFPEKAPEHVRQFLRFTALGLYDGTILHRVIPGFVVQGGDIRNRKPPVDERDRQLLVNLQPEFNDIPHVRGIVSMARSDRLDSGLDSFFVVLDEQKQLDGKYTGFGRVTRGMDVLDALSMVPTAGETPVRPLKVTMRVREKDLP